MDSASFNIYCPFPAAPAPPHTGGCADRQRPGSKLDALLPLGARMQLTDFLLHPEYKLALTTPASTTQGLEDSLSPEESHHLSPASVPNSPMVVHHPGPRPQFRGVVLHTSVSSRPSLWSAHVMNTSSTRPPPIAFHRIRHLAPETHLSFYLQPLQSGQSGLPQINQDTAA